MIIIRSASVAGDRSPVMRLSISFIFQYQAGVSPIYGLTIINNKFCNLNKISKELQNANQNALQQQRQHIIYFPIVS